MQESKKRKYIYLLGYGRCMLEFIIGSKVKVKILRMMMNNVKREYTLQEIVKELGLSFGSAHPAMKELESRRIILSSRVGRSNAYRVNTSHVIFDELLRLFKREGNAYRDIAKELSAKADKTGIQNILLFGSVARGDTLEPGDIDVLIIHDKGFDKEHVKEVISEIEGRHDVHISPIYQTADEVRLKMKRLDNFIVTVLNECIVLYGDDKWLRQ
jgi:predicted nucleotidyltransferase